MITELTDEQKQAIDDTIRRRMANTGESATVARRAIVDLMLRQVQYECQHATEARMTAIIEEMKQTIELLECRLAERSEE